MSGPSTHAHRLPLALAGVILLGACTSYRVQTAPLPEVLAERSPRSVLLTLTADRQVELFDPVVSGDTVRGNLTSASVDRRSVSLRDVRTVAVRQFNLGKSLLAVLAAVGGVVTYQLLMSLNETGF